MAGKRVAILGGGNMGGAIARAIFDNGEVIGIDSTEVVIAEPDAGKHEGLREGNSCQVVSSAREAVNVVAEDGLVVLAVKPQVFAGLAAEVGPVGTRLVISVMAGTSAAGVHASLGGRCRVVRAMPNLPVMQGEGMTAISPGPGAARVDLEFVERLFGRMGQSIQVPESMMDAVTAVASSGIAYVFFLAEAMRRAAVEVGFDSETAGTLVSQTIRGASRMMTGDAVDPAALRARVTSKGGTTQAAIDELERSGVMEAVVRAVRAARDRGRELGGQQTVAGS